MTAKQLARGIAAECILLPVHLFLGVCCLAIGLVGIAVAYPIRKAWADEVALALRNANESMTWIRFRAAGDPRASRYRPHWGRRKS
jgi:hypothetical protein